ncbi:MAG: hypothetical protein WA824_18425 [Candidatus Sulfotelmatobacter sp.]
MALTPAPTCQYQVEPDRRCGRPALRGMRYCYSHQRDHRRNARKLAERARQRWFESVDTSDPRAVQRALAEIVRRLSSGSIDPSKAGAVLYQLHAASVRIGTGPIEHGGAI